jgi:hypothetical protein
MHGLSLPANILTSVASDAVSNIASRVSSTASSFASDLQQAQSGGSSVSSSLAQLGSDLKSGNLSAAQADLAALRHSLPIRRVAAGSSPLAGTAGATSGSTNGSTDPILAALQNSGVLQQTAYSNALNLSMPSTSPSISLDF